jgi:hypothetical protein
VFWLLMAGGVAMGFLFILWQRRYANVNTARALLGLGVPTGFFVGVARSVAFHNRLWCYRAVPVPRRRTDEQAAAAPKGSRVPL